MEKGCGNCKKRSNLFHPPTDKKQVAKELPDKTEMVIYCEMNEAQRSIYNTYEEALRGVY